MWDLHCGGAFAYTYLIGGSTYFIRLNGARTFLPTVPPSDRFRSIPLSDVASPCCHVDFSFSSAMALYESMRDFFSSAPPLSSCFSRILAYPRVLLLISLLFIVICVDVIFGESGFSSCTAMLAKAGILFWSLDYAIVRLRLDDYLSFRTVILLFIVGLKVIEAAPCTTCRGAVEGCDGTNCPWLEGVAENAKAVASATMVITSALCLKKLLPDGLLQAFPRQACPTWLIRQIRA